MRQNDFKETQSNNYKDIKPTSKKQNNYKQINKQTETKNIKQIQNSHSADASSYLGLVMTLSFSRGGGSNIKLVTCSA